MKKRRQLVRVQSGHTQKITPNGKISPRDHINDFNAIYNVNHGFKMISV